MMRWCLEPPNVSYSACPLLACNFLCHFSSPFSLTYYLRLSYSPFAFLASALKLFDPRSRFGCTFLKKKKKKTKNTRLFACPVLLYRFSTFC
ncbi:hypothetical protein BDV36DRAFT_48013 [Aspergillus pseudocaelatus]|uniref:Secreted protein n=1 Tax=Aspergillus pseudocaelatus TaxID=1825620 RepID=A0ABQ6W6N4_9EURO|nr:hypothetical protein BDV36DRAFT_48013 [Aspergillus pseudocaelatus]